MNGIIKRLVNRILKSTESREDLVLFACPEVNEAFRKSRSSKQLSEETFFEILVSFGKKNRHNNFWRLVIDWVQASEYGSDEVFLPLTMIGLKWNYIDAGSRYLAKSIVWRAAINVMFLSDPLSLSRRLDVGRCFFLLHENEVVKGLIGDFCSDLERLSDKEYKDGMVVLKNHKFFLEELAQSSEEDLHILGNMLLDLH